MDKQQILGAMLNDVPETYDKRPGSFIYDSLAPPAAQLERIDATVEDVKDKLSIDNLNGVELAQRVRERTGITRRAATRAIGRVTLTGTGTIQVGDLFETEAGTQFRATISKSITLNGVVDVEAVVPGASGNVATGTIILFPVTLAGFTAVINSQPTRDGFDEESDVDLLQRYYERIRTPATSGNKAHYLNWTKEVNGVGDARIIPLWNGSNTVKVVIIDLNRLPASPQLVQEVQDYIDPGISGAGNGMAPIGAYTTVASASAVTINVQLNAAITIDAVESEVKDNIKNSISQYLRSIALIDDFVSYAKVGAAILNSQGVSDYSNLQVNGGNSNVAIGQEQVAVLGTVTVNVI